jgi:hypothetical protein
MLHRLSLRVLVAVSSLIVGGFAPSPSQATTAPATEPNPLVQGPIQGGTHGYMWNHSLFDLQKYDYTENEYFYSGVATVRQNGQTITAPYKSRFFVRLPRDPRKFNGTIAVEWLNVTDQDDLETAYPPGGEYQMSQGLGIVGVSAQLAGVCCGPTTLKGWDPARYATLAHPGDTFAADIFTQAIQALRHPEGNRTDIGTQTPVDPMLGMRAKHVVALGASQSASQLTSYINAGYNSAKLIDLYIITRGGGPFNDLSTPVWQLNEEAQGPHPPDSSHYVLWEEAGTAHAPAAWYDYVWTEKSRDQAVPGTPNPVAAGCALNRGSVDYSTRAITYWAQIYLNGGRRLPSAPRLKRDAAGNVVRDANTLAEGGLRHPFIEVPVSLNRSETTDCPLFGLHRAWSAAKIVSMYPTHTAYVRKVAAWADYEVSQGWMIPADRDDVVRKAQGFDGPWTRATCYDTYNAHASEKGPLSSALAAASYDPNLPLGTQGALRDVNCNAVVPLGL